MALRDLLVYFGVEVDQRPLIEAQRNVNALVIRFNQLQRIAGFAMAALGGVQIVKDVDAYIDLENSIKQVTETTAEFNAAQRGIVDIARRTKSPLDDVAAVFQRYSQVTSELGMAQSDVLDFTLRLTQAMKLGRGSAAESRGAMIQLAQGIGTNFEAAGQEIRSVQEQSPILAKIIANAAGGTAADLMRLAKQGKITSKLVVEAVRDAGPELERLFSKRTMKFEDVSNRFRTEWLLLIKQFLPTLTKIIDKLGDVVQIFQEWVEEGSAANAAIAALTTVVIGLTFAFAGLTFQLLLAAAPWAALFLLIDDFVTFMRGGRSVIGHFLDEMFGHDSQDLTRQLILDLWRDFKGFLAFLSGAEDPWKAFYDKAVEWGGKAVDWVKLKLGELGDTMRYKMAELGDALAASLRGALGNTAANFLGVPQGYEQRRNLGLDKIAAEEQAAVPYMDQQTRALDAWKAKPREFLGDTIGDFFGLPKRGDTELDMAWQQIGRNAQTPIATPSMPGGGGSTVNAPVTITNEITVQGNATSAVAREVADRAGAATASAATDRDRGAIGAMYGIP